MKKSVGRSGENTDVLRRYIKLYRQTAKEKEIDFDLDSNNSFHFRIYRLEDLVSMVNGIVPPSIQSPYWITLVRHGRGMKKIGSYSFPIQDNTFFLVPSRTLHSSSYDSFEVSGYLLNFSLEFFISQAFPTIVVEKRKVFRHALRPYIYLSENDTLRLTSVFEAIMEENSRQGGDKNEVLILKIIELLILCDRLFCASGLIDEKLSFHPVIRNFLAIVEENYRFRHDVIYYANQLAIHPNHLNYLLKKYQGTCAKQSINERIIKEAKMLLTATPFLIKDIARMVGFTDPNNFSTFFLKNTGYTPFAYRLLNQVLC